MIIKDRIVKSDINFLRFLYPTYKVVSDNIGEDELNTNIIYNGDFSRVDDIVSICDSKNLEYIIKSSFSEIDLNDRRILANIIFEKWRNGVLPKYLEEIIDYIDKDDFIEAVKIKWVTGKWLIYKIEDETSFLELLDTLNKSKYGAIKVYFDILKKSKSYKIESSLLTFMTKARQEDYKGTLFNYQKKLKTYKGDKLKNTLNAIYDSLDYNIDNKELRLLNLFMNIQDSTKQ